MKDRYILLADDDADDVMMVQKALRAAGFEGRIEVAHDGEELLVHLDAGVPDLVVLDLNMPRKSGLEALREIKTSARLKAIPVVILTTSSSSSDVKSCYAVGANSYVVKPMSFSGITDVVGTMVDYWLRSVKLPTRVE